MYTVKKIETPDRGEMFAVVTGENVENVINRFTNEDDAKENCTLLNGGEVAEKKLAAAEKKAEEDAKKVAEADQKSRAAAKPKAAAPKTRRRPPQAPCPRGQGQGARQAHGTEAHPPAQVTMHTYINRGTGWMVGYYPPTPLVKERLAGAAQYSASNGRPRPSPVSSTVGATAQTRSAHLRRPVDEEDDDNSIHPDRPKAFDNDYPLEGTQSTSAPAPRKTGGSH